MRIKVQSGHIKTPGLVNYWSFNSHIKDMIGGAHLYNGKKAGLTTDRFGRPLSALNLNRGYYQIPPGNYFPTGQFTITAWIKSRNFGYYPSVVTFANGYNFDTISFGFRDSIPIYSHFAIFNDNNLIASHPISSNILLGGWTYLTITFDKNLNIRIYVDANLADSSSSTQPLKNTTRVLNYVGRGDNYPTQPDIDAIIDELKIFNRALSQQEIQNEMNIN